MFLTVQDLKKSYKTGEVESIVLKEASLELDKGEIGVILGPSGSGKSTMMNIIGGIDRADSGSVILDGTDVTKLNDIQLADFRREQLGYIFQFYNLIPNLTVKENIEVTVNITKNPLPVDSVLNLVGLLNRANSFPRELSGGEQQRVAIARAVVKNPALLLCDEPTGALDYATSKDILTLIEEINIEYGTTILMITHNTAISGMANRVYKLRSGEIVEATINKTKIEPEKLEW